MLPTPRHLRHLAGTKGIFSTFLFQTHCKHQPVIIINLKWDRQSTKVYRCVRQTDGSWVPNTPSHCVPALAGDLGAEQRGLCAPTQACGAGR